MSTPSRLAKLHVFLARDAPFGLILRRGPTNQVCTIGWNLTDDTFELGQWFKGRIYPHRCDLSPNGKYFLYFATKPQAIRSEGPSSWTAMSRTPHLKAIEFWEQTSTCGGGGRFEGDNAFFLNHQGDYLSQLPEELKQTPPLVRQSDWEEESYAYHLRREGWQSRGPTLWEKKRLGWTLNQFARNPHQLSYEARNAPNGKPLDEQHWDWADFDSDWLVWAQGGKLFSTQINEGEHGDITELADFNDWKFQPIHAPY